MRDLTPVLLEDGFREALEDGGILEVHCLAPVTHERGVVSGQWKFFVLHQQDGDPYRQVLILQRGLKHRIFTTAAGVASFALGLGASTVCIPMVEGGIGVCKVPNSGRN
ncbi:hypothetical protein [Ruegeria jejuensis]|uniref:hypothetical protein n=1 Tax=Ruegeria jejuensis TaxID=3233338 RepID=UPI00355C70B0